MMGKDNDGSGCYFMSNSQMARESSWRLSSDLNDEGASHVDIWGMNVPDKVCAKRPKE